MSETLQKRFLIAAILLAVFNVLGFNHLLELMAEEPRRSIIAIEMLWSGDFAIPHIYEEIYYNKPPLYNWLIAASMYLFGTGEWAARLPGALSFLLTGFILFKIASRHLSHKVSLFVAFAYITSIDLLFYGSVNTAEIDIFYSLITVLQVYAIFHYKQSGNYLKLFVVSYLLAAIGVLTKGIPTIAFQGLTLLGYFIATKSFGKLFSWKHLVGCSVFLVVVVGYLYYFSLYEDVWALLSQQFQEASQRSANETSILDLIKNLFLFVFILIQKLLPWSILGLFFFYKSVRKQLIENKLLYFSLVFILANILIYWTALDLRTRYIYMFFPFLILLVGAGIDKVNWEDKIPKRILQFFLFLIIVAPLALIALPFIINNTSFLTFIIVILIISALVFNSYITIKNKSHDQIIWSLIIALLLIRLAFNALVMPKMTELSSRMHYRKTISELVEHSGGKEIMLAGPISTGYPKISFFGEVFYEDVLNYPTEVTFKIPYYYAHQTGKIIKYAPELNSKAVNYIIYEKFLNRYPEEKDTLYRFFNEYNSEYIVLFSLK
ncbi:MAG: 4-amino-4-deoxy-L-arabinose transferase-like glycosyltransferase [Salibacteraceae bacterium]|jgi:4-amino-4-deoxy-L-arabinose transferase-like glycosyltransferase